MQFTISKSTLLPELIALQGIAERRNNTTPILQNIHLHANASLTLRATDLDIACQTGCAAEIAVPGKLCVNAKKLADIVKSLSGAEIQFSVGKGKETRLNITSDRAKFSLACLESNVFPELPTHDGAYITLPGALLRTLITRTQFAITQEESRYNLNGARLELNKASARMVATDGHRLALAESKIPEIPEEALGKDGKWEVLIPRKTLVEIAKLADGAETVELALGADGYHLFARAGDRWLASKLLAGNFPDYAKVLPKTQYRAVVNTEALAGALRRVGLMADEKTSAIQIVVTGGEPGKIVVKAPASERGEADETILADYAGPEIALAFNADYLTKFLAVCSTKDVAVEMTDSASATQLQPVGETAVGYRYVAMPMRL